MTRRDNLSPEDFRATSPRGRQQVKWALNWLELHRLTSLLWIISDLRTSPVWWRDCSCEQRRELSALETALIKERANIRRLQKNASSAISQHRRRLARETRIEE